MSCSSSSSILSEGHQYLPVLSYCRQIILKGAVYQQNMKLLRGKVNLRIQDMVVFVKTTELLPAKKKKSCPPSLQHYSHSLALKH